MIEMTRTETAPIDTLRAQAAAVDGHLQRLDAQIAGIDREGRWAVDEVLMPALNNVGAERRLFEVAFGAALETLRGLENHHQVLKQGAEQVGLDYGAVTGALTEGARVTITQYREVIAAALAHDAELEAEHAGLIGRLEQLVSEIAELQHTQQLEEAKEKGVLDSTTQLSLQYHLDQHGKLPSDITAEAVIRRQNEFQIKRARATEIERQHRPALAAKIQAALEAIQHAMTTLWEPPLTVVPRLRVDRERQKETTDLHRQRLKEEMGRHIAHLLKLYDQMDIE